MVVPLELQHFWSSSGGAGEPQSRLNRFGAGHVETKLLRRWQNVHQHLRRLDLGFMLRPVENPLAELGIDGIHYRLRPVP